jgi:hypothetical protein
MELAFTHFLNDVGVMRKDIVVSCQLTRNDGCVHVIRKSDVALRHSSQCIRGLLAQYLAPQTRQSLVNLGRWWRKPGLRYIDVCEGRRDLVILRNAKFELPGLCFALT